MSSSSAWGMAAAAPELGAGADALIVNYNAGPWLARCIRALRKQPALRRIVVVDNASSDDSLALAELADATVIRNTSNRGYARAMAQAAAASSAPFLLLVNPDLELASGALAALLATAAEHPRAGVVGALVTDLAGHEQRACRRRTPTPLRSTITMLGLERVGLPGVNIRAPMPAAPLPLDAVSGAVLLLRRACWNELDGFDPGYFLHCEDLDLFRRARQAGWEVWFQPAAQARHAGGVSQRGGRLAAERHKRDGMLRYFRRFDAPRLGPLAPLWVALIRVHFALRAPWLRRRDRRPS